MVISNECNKFIKNVVLDFTNDVHSVKKLLIIEKIRQNKTRLEIILLLKLYKGMELSKKEKKILEKHMLQYDVKTDLSRCICQVAYEIADQVYEKVYYINLDNMRNSRNTSKIYNDYLKKMKRYENSLLHAMCGNHQIVLVDPQSNENLYPIINFDSDIFVNNEKRYTKKNIGN